MLSYGSNGLKSGLDEIVNRQNPKGGSGLQLGPGVAKMVSTPNVVCTFANGL